MSFWGSCMVLGLEGLEWAYFGLWVLGWVLWVLWVVWLLYGINFRTKKVQIPKVTARVSYVGSLLGSLLGSYLGSFHYDCCMILGIINTI
jgi:hypothetical protein